MKFDLNTFSLVNFSSMAEYVLHRFQLADKTNVRSVYGANGNSNVGLYYLLAHDGLDAYPKLVLIYGYHRNEGLADFCK